MKFSWHYAKQVEKSAFVPNSYPQLMPSNQVPPAEPVVRLQPETPANATKNNENGAFRLHDSAMPFDANYDQNLMDKPNSRIRMLSTSESQQKASKKMKKEIHATTATGTLPLRKINK